MMNEQNCGFKKKSFKSLLEIKIFFENLTIYFSLFSLYLARFSEDKIRGTYIQLPVIQI